jgi:hypothetical protein
MSRMSARFSRSESRPGRAFAWLSPRRRLLVIHAVLHVRLSACRTELDVAGNVHETAEQRQIRAWRYIAHITRRDPAEADTRRSIDGRTLVSSSGREVLMNRVLLTGRLTREASNSGSWSVMAAG